MATWDGGGDPWGHEHGEDPAHLLDGSGHVRAAPGPQAFLLGEPRVVTAAGRAGSAVARLLLGVLGAAALAAGFMGILALI